MNTFFPISELDRSIFSKNKDIRLFPIPQVDNSYNWMCRLRFPFRLFGLIISNRPLFCTNHNSIINPTNWSRFSYNFSIIIDNIDSIKSDHRHILKAYNNIFAFIRLIRFNYLNIFGQMINILFFSTVCKWEQIRVTCDIDRIVGSIQLLCIFKLFCEYLIIIYEIPTTQIITCQNKNLIWGQWLNS